MKKFTSPALKTCIGLFAAFAVPIKIHACACGCGVFDVATSSMLPSGAGLMTWIQYDYQDQNRDWHGTSTAPAALNNDRDIETHFLMADAQYMFNSQWGVQLELPYDFRHYSGTDDSGILATHNWSQFGDLRVEGLYTGFFPDLSAGVTFGLKLPTGNFKEDPGLIDRDTQIGTGSADFLLGGFYRGEIPNHSMFGWFAQGLLDVPALTQDGYRPGVELDTAAGLYYKGLSVGRAHISPIGQLIFSERTSDSGPAADPADTGYQRLLLSPGVEVDIHPVIFYADVEFPIFQHFTGYQLAAPVMFKVSVSYMF